MCNNPLCFNPEHLKLGTQYENDYDDKIENNTLQRGNKHYNSSISEDVAQKMQLIEGKLRSARNNALSIVNTPEFAEMYQLWKTNRKAMYSRYYDMFKTRDGY